MLFRRKGKKTGGGSQSRNRPAKRTGATAQSAKTGGRTTKTAGQAKASSQSKGRGHAKGGAQAKNTAAPQQSRAQAEAQIKQMMNDGSLDKVKTLLNARNPNDVAADYPEETVGVIRNWLNDPDR